MSALNEERATVELRSRESLFTVLLESKQASCGVLAIYRLHSLVACRPTGGLHVRAPFL